MKELTQERLKSIFHYDPDTGIFTRIAKIGRRGKIGNTVGTLHKVYGYIIFRVDGVLYLSHRLAWLYVFGYLPKFQVDHINHNRADNKILNLREVTHSDNQRNKSLSKRNKSGVTGVYWYEPTKKWHASIMWNGKIIHLGYFANKIDAVKVRKDAEFKYGYHKNHGGVL